MYSLVVNRFVEGGNEEAVIGQGAAKTAWVENLDPLNGSAYYRTRNVEIG